MLKVISSPPPESSKMDENKAKALSAAFQFVPSNDSSPVRVWSRGGGGSVWQGNTSSSRGDSGNRATTAGEAMQAS